ncbi:hypothetical protein A5651_00180 [Mycobacterium sp. 1274761.0]|nr:hypothetical protein A5651_00180 [Mycobacterium sp. 1274761.0]
MEDRDLAVSSSVVATVVAAGMCAEDEAAEKDNRDDEDGAGDDADPRGDRGESPTVFDHGRPFRLWCRGCFAHVFEDASAGHAADLFSI